jgi:hypothetical protein
MGRVKAAGLGGWFSGGEASLVLTSNALIALPLVILAATSAALVEQRAADTRRVTQVGDAAVNIRRYHDRAIALICSYPAARRARAFTRRTSPLSGSARSAN